MESSTLPSNGRANHPTAIQMPNQLLWRVSSLQTCWQIEKTLHLAMPMVTWLISTRSSKEKYPSPAFNAMQLAERGENAQSSLVLSCTRNHLLDPMAFPTTVTRAVPLLVRRGLHSCINIPPRRSYANEHHAISPSERILVLAGPIFHPHFLAGTANALIRCTSPRPRDCDSPAAFNVSRCHVRSARSSRSGPNPWRPQRWVEQADVDAQEDMHEKNA
ncbi:hypothetical protein K438DRAFT_205588 [Mycena galopus ATCC 62051]|nr:hypothetical protein K438DRAFT_205588 [Mycena galopus ATCC 62051]